MWSIWGLIKSLRESVLMCASRLVHVFDGKPVQSFFNSRIQSLNFWIFLCMFVFIMSLLAFYKSSVTELFIGFLQW